MTKFLKIYIICSYEIYGVCVRELINVTSTKIHRSSCKNREKNQEGAFNITEQNRKMNIK